MNALDTILSLFWDSIQGFFKKKTFPKWMSDWDLLNWHINKNLQRIKSILNQDSCETTRCLEEDFSCYCRTPCLAVPKLLQNILLSCSQTCSEVLASTDIEVLFSTCSWVRLVKQFQCSTNNMWNLFGQHTQAYITFMFVIIKTLHSIRMGSTNFPFLMMTNQMTILTWKGKNKCQCRTS